MVLIFSGIIFQVHTYHNTVWKEYCLDHNKNIQMVVDNYVVMDVGISRV